MKDVLVLIVFALIFYVIYKVALKEPLLPWKKGKKTPFVPTNITKNSNKKGGASDPFDVIEAAQFSSLFKEVMDTKNHMIRRYDNSFSILVEVEPVNYFLLDADEQGGIDAAVEVWLAQIEYSLRIYLQNRFVDLTLPIQDIQEVMKNEEGLHKDALQFGQNMVDNLTAWQRSQPRYETKRYLVFDYHVETKDIKANSVEEFDEKVIDKAFKELYRRFMTAEAQLDKAGIGVSLLSSDGINEVLYYGFNRRKATKNRYRDIEQHEQLSLYVTADQTAEQIIRVKGEIEDVQKEDQERKVS